LENSNFLVNLKSIKLRR